MKNPLKKLFCGNRETHRLSDEKGNLIPLSRLVRNGPKAFYSFFGRKFLNMRPQVPWISYDARRLLTRLLPREATVLEFGSGNSTVWFGRHFQSVFSVEHNADWHACVQLMLRQARLSNVHYFLHDEPAYSHFDEVAHRQFDFVLIDGIVRSACVVTALQRLKLDSVLYLDNSDKHPQGGDTRLAEEALLTAARERGGRVLYFTDFVPTDFAGNQGLMVLLGRFASGAEVWKV
jgi:predicted O-methyltransferase YrrM